MVAKNKAPIAQKALKSKIFLFLPLLKSFIFEAIKNKATTINIPLCQRIGKWG